MTLADELLRVPVDAIAAFGKSDFYGGGGAGRPPGDYDGFAKHLLAHMDEPRSSSYLRHQLSDWPMWRVRKTLEYAKSRGLIRQVGQGTGTKWEKA